MSLTTATLPEHHQTSSVLTKQKGLLMGYYGVRNLGDEMMLYCLSRWLGEQRIEVTILAEHPDEVEYNHHLPAVQNAPLLGEWGFGGGMLVWLRGTAWKVLQELRHSDLVIAGGGDTIRDDQGMKQFFYATEKLLLALLLKKRISLLNVGVAQVKTPFGCHVLQWIVTRSSMTVVRDDASFELCRTLGARHLYRAEDIACSLPAQFGFGTGSPAEVGVRRHMPGPPSRFHSSSPDPYILVCLRHECNVYGQYALSDLRLQHLAAALDHISSVYGLRVLFMPFQGSDQANDNQLHGTVFDLMSCRDRAQICPWTSDLRKAISRIAGARCVIAMRLHAAVLAVASQRPCIVMPYDKKVSEFQAASGIPYSITENLLESRERVIEVIAKCLEVENLGFRDLSNSWDKIKFLGILEPDEA